MTKRSMPGRSAPKASAEAKGNSAKSSVSANDARAMAREIAAPSPEDVASLAREIAAPPAGDAATLAREVATSSAEEAATLAREIAAPSPEEAVTLAREIAAPPAREDVRVAGEIAAPSAEDVASVSSAEFPRETAASKEEPGPEPGPEPTLADGDPTWQELFDQLAKQPVVAPVDENSKGFDDCEQKLLEGLRLVQERGGTPQEEERFRKPLRDLGSALERLSQVRASAHAVESGEKAVQAAVVARASDAPDVVAPEETQAASAASLRREDSPEPMRAEAESSPKENSPRSPLNYAEWLLSMIFGEAAVLELRSSDGRSCALCHRLVGIPDGTRTRGARVRRAESGGAAHHAEDGENNGEERADVNVHGDEYSEESLREAITT